MQAVRLVEEALLVDGAVVQCTGVFREPKRTERSHQLGEIDGEHRRMRHRDGGRFRVDVDGRDIDAHAIFKAHRIKASDTVQGDSASSMKRKLYPRSVFSFLQVIARTIDAELVSTVLAALVSADHHPGTHGLAVDGAGRPRDLDVTAARAH